MLEYDESSGEWVEQPEASSGETADTGLTVPSFWDTSNLSDLGWNDVQKLFSGFGNVLSGKSGTGAQLLGLAGVGSLLNKILGSSTGPTGGYGGKIPTYYATRTMNPIPTTTTIPATATDPAQVVRRRPGSGGISYFSPMVYSTTPPAAQTTTNMAAGGISSLGVDRYNLGGYSDGGRLLRGPGDGVSDDIPATIGDKQPARLANNEFVIPARIVSEIGNGSTDAGARKLYAMMERVQRRRKKTVGKGKVAVDSGAHKEVDKL